MYIIKETVLHKAAARVKIRGDESEADDDLLMSKFKSALAFI